MKSVPSLPGFSVVAKITKQLCGWTYVALTYFLMSCASDSAEELLEEFLLQDSLQNNIPAIIITNPAESDTVQLPLVINYVLENWEVSPQGRHLQYFINNENKGLIYNSNEALIASIDTGYHVVMLRLALPNFRTIEVYDDIGLYIEPLPADKFQLIINNGTGSGAFEAGELITIAADDPAPSFEFAQWVGDTDFLNGNFPTTSLVMPSEHIELTATYQEIPADYELDIQPIISNNCLACHDGLYEPNLANCDNLSVNATEVAANIIDELDPMPPTGLMSQENIDIILRWIDQGANCEE